MCLPLLPNPSQSPLRLRRQLQPPGLDGDHILLCLWQRHLRLVAVSWQGTSQYIFGSRAITMAGCFDYMQPLYQSQHAWWQRKGKGHFAFGSIGFQIRHLRPCSNLSMPIYDLHVYKYPARRSRSFRLSGPSYQPKTNLRSSFFPSTSTCKDIIDLL